MEVERCAGKNGQGRAPPFIYYSVEIITHPFSLAPWRPQPPRRRMHGTVASFLSCRAPCSVRAQTTSLGKKQAGSREERGHHRHHHHLKCTKIRRSLFRSFSCAACMPLARARSRSLARPPTSGAALLPSLPSRTPPRVTTEEIARQRLSFSLSPSLSAVCVARPTASFPRPPSFRPSSLAPRRSSREPDRGREREPSRQRANSLLKRTESQAGRRAGGRWMLLLLLRRPAAQPAKAAAMPSSSSS